MKQVANDEANSVLNVDLAGERKMLEARKEGEASKVSRASPGPMRLRRVVLSFEKGCCKNKGAREYECTSDFNLKR